MIAEETDVILRSSKITNLASTQGGVLKSVNSLQALKTILIENCTIESNEATMEGGAIYSFNSILNIVNSKFKENNSPKGGAI